MQLENINNWFLENKRDFPWRKETTPYRVWISEVMLQQTRSSVVIEYFNRWMEKFPTIRDLADSDEDQVMKLWEGLGYYSRARNIHGGAKDIISRFGGDLPDTYEDLITIKGLGPYTAGAILSFAFHQRSPALDGNVMRVLSRLVAFEKEVQSSKTELTKILLEILPKEDAHITMEGLIELGATVCMKRPHCEECPVKSHCKAFQTNCVEQFPIVKKRPKIEHLHRSVFCFHHKNQILLKQNGRGIMEGLWEFPYYEGPLLSEMPSSFMISQKNFRIKAEKLVPMKPVKHHFTKYCATLYPFYMEIDEDIDIEGYSWVELKAISQRTFSSGHKKIVAALFKDHFKYD